ncbi:unnamed protein product, partial [Musa textilis]
GVASPSSSSAAASAGAGGWTPDVRGGGRPPALHRLPPLAYGNSQPEPSHHRRHHRLRHCRLLLHPPPPPFPLLPPPLFLRRHCLAAFSCPLALRLRLLRCCRRLRPLRSGECGAHRLPPGVHAGLRPRLPPQVLAGLRCLPLPVPPSRRAPPPPCLPPRLPLVVRRTLVTDHPSCPLCRSSIALPIPPPQLPQSSAAPPATVDRDTSRSGSFRIEIGSVSHQRTSSGEESGNNPPPLPPSLRTYSIGSSFEYLVEEEVEAVVARIARRTEKVVKPGDSAANASPGAPGRRWQKRRGEGEGG